MRVVSRFNETAQSFFVCGSSRASAAPQLLLLSGLYRVHGLRVSSHCDVARCHFLLLFSFEKVCFFVSSLPPYLLFLFFFFISVAGWPFRTRY